MKLLCKSIGAGVILLAAAGCAGEGPSQSAPNAPPAAAPPPSANAQANPARGGMSVAGQPPGSAVASAPHGEAKADSGPKIEGPNVDGGQAAAKTTDLSSDQLTAIKELPASEQQAAIAQHSCPVSGEPLGSMGKPFKVSAEGRSFYLCCKGCEKDVKADPKKVLAKLDQKRP